MVEELKMEEVEILDVREVPSAAPERMGKFDVMITYRFDPMHTYVTTMPKEDFNEEDLKTLIKKEMAERMKWIGKKLTL